MDKTRDRNAGYRRDDCIRDPDRDIRRSDRKGNAYRNNGRTAPRRSTKHHPYIDYSMIFIIIFLLAFGLVILYSASYYEASMDSGCNCDPAFYMKKQLRWLVFGFIAMALVANIKYEFYHKIWLPAFIASLVLVACCLAFDPVNGARRWIYIGSFSLQPAEIVKICTIIMMAELITRFGTALSSLRVILFVMVGPLSAALMLYFVTKNLSSAIIVLCIAIGMIFVARPDYLKFFLAAAGVTGAAGLVVYAASNSSTQDSLGFRSKRIIAWLDPEKYAKTYGYQTIQALYAIGSGGLFGKGLGKSMQKLGYIPEVQNDMIFSIICEELGIFGAVAIIAMFGLLCWRIMWIADHTKDAYGSFLVVGVFCHIAVQVVLNIAVVTNTIPNTGVTLPFISYGGSSLLFTMAEIGIVLNVAKHIQVE